MKQKLLKTWLMLCLLVFGVGTTWAEDVTLKFTNIGANASSTNVTSKTTLSLSPTGSSDSYTFNYYQGKKQNNAILLTKSAGAYISNNTPIPGTIKSIKVYINSGASGSTTYHCAFNTSECTSAYTTGSTAENITGGNNHTYTNSSVSGAQYFCISLGNANNGQVLGFDVTYTTGGSSATQYSYSLVTVGSGTTTFKDGSGNTIAPNQKVNSGTKIYPTFTPDDGYKFTSWEYWGTSDGVEQWKPLNGEYFTITKDVKFRVTYSAVVPKDKYAVTILTPENGTLTIKDGETVINSGDEVEEGKTLTVEVNPADGYRFKNWGYKDGDAAWVGNMTSNFTHTMPSAPCSFKATFEEIPTYTVTFSVNGRIIQSEPYEENATVTPPTVSDINGKQFVGWVKEDVVVNPSIEPTYETIDKATKNIAYVAVFATASGSGDGKSHSISTFNDGTYFMIDKATIGTDVKYFAMSGAPTSNKIAAVDVSEFVTVTDGEMTIEPSNSVWTNAMKYNVSSDENNIYIKNGDTNISMGASSTNITTGTTNKLELGIKEDNSGRFAALFNPTTGTKRCLLYAYQTINGKTTTDVNAFKAYSQANMGTNDSKNGYYGEGYFWMLPVNATSASYSDFTTTPTPVTKYDVTILDEEIENGTVTADPATAAEGETVTLTITPDDGYTLVQLMVTNLETYDEIEVEDNEFVMPAADVEVFAYFQPASSKTYTLSELAAAGLDQYSVVSVSIDNEIIDIQMDEEEGGYIALTDGDNTFVLQTNYPCDAEWAIGGTLAGTWKNVYYAEQPGAFILMNMSDDPWADLEYTPAALTLALDENAASIDEICDRYDEVTVTRTLKAGIWNTLCLPFSMTADEITANFGEGAVVKELSGLTVDDEGNFKINFSTASEIAEATPYLVKVENAVSEIIVTGKEVVIDPTKDDQTATVDDGGDNCVTFHGNYGKTTIEQSENNYVLSSNKFYYVNSIVTNKGFRGWFETFSMSAGVKALTLSFEDNTTAVKNVTIEGLDDDAVFDLTGRKVAKAQKGIYIKNNRKFLAK